jgi:hypothetical protein
MRQSYDSRNNYNSQGKGSATFLRIITTDHRAHLFFLFFSDAPWAILLAFLLVRIRGKRESYGKKIKLAIYQGKKVQSK